MPQEQMLNSGEVEKYIWRAQRKKSCARVNSRRIKLTSSVKLAIHMMPRSSTCERPIFRLQEGLCVVGRETKLAFFAGHVELQQTGNAAFETASLFVDFAEQLWTVHAVNQ